MHLFQRSFLLSSSEENQSILQQGLEKKAYELQGNTHDKLS